MTDAIDEKSVVLARHPHAVAHELKDWHAYHWWVIHADDCSFFRFPVGGGPTEAEAWHNAWVYIDAAERGKARLEGEGDR